MTPLARDLGLDPAVLLLLGLTAIGASSCSSGESVDASMARDGSTDAGELGGRASSSGGAAGAASAASGGRGGSVSTGGRGGAPACLPGCILLCEGGACDCSCPPTPSCEDFARPALDKSCATDDDCFAGIHHLDCCGSVIVLGYNQAAAANFATYEADCKGRATCPCPSGTPTLEDGQATSDVKLAFPRCISGQCFGSGPVFTGRP